jgi:hypothetical protein
VQRHRKGIGTMTNLDAVIQDLVIANRILAREEVVDAYGHVSVRHPDNPNRLLIARSLRGRILGRRNDLRSGCAARADDTAGLGGARPSPPAELCGANCGRGPARGASCGPRHPPGSSRRRAAAEPGRDRDRAARLLAQRLRLLPVLAS